MGHLPPRTRGDAVRGGALIFETTPSQTVGPYFAIGLPFDVGPFAVARRHPRRDPHHGHDLRRRRRADPRLPARDLAGRPRREVRRHVRIRRPFGARRLPRLRPLRPRGRRRHVRPRDRQAGAGAGPRRRHRRRPTSTCRCSREACSTARSRGSTSQTRPRPTPATRCSRACRSSAARRCSPSRTTRLPVRHPLPGAARDRLLRGLSRGGLGR